MGQKFAITHIKADFDAIASAWGAYRLHDCDAILIITDMETNVGTYFKDIDSSPIRLIKSKDIEAIKSIDHLIITDCKQKKRIGQLQELLPKAEKITIYDHHPAYAKDIDGNEEIITSLGCTTTTLVRKLIENNIYISPEDATLYLLGIYEDTGLLTFSSTTSEDARAVADLIELGGDVSTVSDFIKRDFSREQVFVLNELLMNMSTINVDGVNIAYSYASIDVYIDELAFLAQRMMDMEGVESLFILVRSGPRVVLIGRSKNNLVDAGKIVARFGGGGHPAAASAIIKDIDLHEAVSMLLVTLREQIKPVKSVSEIMSFPAKAIDIDATIKNAMDFTLKHNLNHMPVTEGDKIAGILSRKDILQAIKHELTHEHVSLLMQTEFETVHPNTPFRIAESILVSSTQKLLPVEEDDKLVGVITRTDLLRLMHEESIQRTSYEEGARTRMGLSQKRSVLNMLSSDLPAEIYECIVDIGKIASLEGIKAYVVGGFVRDLLMGRANADMDIVVEGDAVIIASLYAQSKNAKLTLHDKYKTGTVTLPGGQKIDFATSRSEFYSTPGASPSVEFSSLRLDLTRRDFTINAMAICIYDDDFGQLIDFFGGQRDILDGKIRVLHSLSFIDDPTRAFRAVRFSARYGFKLGSHTERLLKHADKLGMYDRIQGGKLFIELKYILQEDQYLDSLLMLRKYGILSYVSPKLAINDDRIEQFNTLERIYRKAEYLFDSPIQIWQVRYALLILNYSYKEYDEALKNLHVEETLSAKLLRVYSYGKNTARKIKAMKTPKPSDIYNILIKLHHEELLLLYVILGEKYDYLVSSFIEKDRFVTPELNGNDLKKMGIPPSEKMGDILKELLYAKLDGQISTRGQEEEYVRNRK